VTLGPIALVGGGPKALALAEELATLRAWIANIRSVRDDSFEIGMPHDEAWEALERTRQRVDFASGSSAQYG